MAISLKELNPKGVALSDSHMQNLTILHERMNKVRAAYGKPMVVTSGVRSLDDHKRVYRELAAKRGVTAIRIPMGSQHLAAAACDISDPKGLLMEWCKSNEGLLAEIGLWVEEPDDQKRCHFQIVPPRSGRRFFKP